MSKQSGRGRVAGLPEWDRCAVMGVVNVTPDSFSDGGRLFDTTAAVKHGLDLVAEGADLVDVGGESTRPGATRVDEDEELQPRRPRRPRPRLRGRHGLRRHHARLRRRTGPRRRRRPRQRRQRRPRRPRDDPGRRRRRRPLRRHALARLPARAATSGACTPTSSPKSSTSCTRAWRPSSRAASPPSASSSTPASASPRTPNTTSPSSPTSTVSSRLGHPLLVAASRKRFLGRVLAGPEGAPPPARERDAATAAVSALAAHAGAWAVRVHEVRATADAVRVARAVDGGAQRPSTGAERESPVSAPAHRRRAGRSRQHRLLRGTGARRLRGAGVALADPGRPGRRRGVPRPGRRRRGLLRRTPAGPSSPAAARSSGRTR